MEAPRESLVIPILFIVHLMVWFLWQCFGRLGPVWM